MGLLVHVSLFMLCPSVANLFFRLFGIKNIDQAGNIGLIADIILYVVVYILPSIFILAYCPKKDDPISYKPVFSPNFAVSVLFLLGIVAIVSRITAVSRIFFEQFGIGFYSPAYTVPDGIFGKLLLFVSMAVVPAVVEEILFRKIVLGKLLPYGTLFALFVSSAAFSLMHCNPSQTLYAFAAGLILGTVAIKSKSIFPTIIMHGLNNALAFAYILMEKYMQETAYLYTVSAIDWVIRIGGLFAFVYLWKRGFFELEKNELSLDFSPAKRLLRPLVVFYISYTLFLCLRWMYLL